MTFGLEVTVLFLTNPTYRSVTNNVVTLRLMQPSSPRWGGVRFHNRVSSNRPCTVTAFEYINQGSTRINNCITTSLFRTFSGPFDEIGGDIDLRIVSDLHDYGAENNVSIGEFIGDIFK